MHHLLSTLRTSDPSDCERRTTAILDAGFEGLVVEPPLHEPIWNRLLQRLPRNLTYALRLFLPYPREVKKGEHLNISVAEPQSSLRAAAIQLGLRTLEAADKVGARRVLLPVVELDDETLDRAYADPMRAPDLDPRRRAAREAEARARLSAAMSTLSPLLDRAERYDVHLCLTPSQRFGEFPSYAETANIAEEFRGAPLAMWLDSARLPAELLDAPRIGAAVDEGDSLASSRELPVVGLSLHDAREDRERLPFGAGSLEWSLLASSFRRYDVWCADVEVTDLDDFAIVHERLRDYAQPSDSDAASDGGVFPQF